MPTLTAIILSGFVAYAIGWYSGRIEGSFALLLLLHMQMLRSIKSYKNFLP